MKGSVSDCPLTLNFWELFSPTAGPLPRGSPCHWHQPGGEPHSCAAAPEPQPHCLLLVDWPKLAGAPYTPS